MKDLVTGAILLAVWAVLWRITSDWPSHASGFVRLILAVAIALTLLLVAQGAWHLAAARYVSAPSTGAGWARKHLRAMAERTLDKEADAPSGMSGVTAGEQDRVAPRNLAVFAGASAAYVGLMSMVGYMVSTLAFGLLMLGPVFRWRPIPMLSIVVAVVCVYWFATRQMLLRLPEGWFI